MGSEICVYFSSRRVKESLKDIKVGLGGKETGFFLTPIRPFAKTLKIVGVREFVESAFLYKTRYLTKL
jgi:hypothetical protein